MKEKKVIGSGQHEFTKAKLCLTNMTAFKDEMTGWLNKGRAVDTVYFDFSKPFSTVFHNILIQKLITYRLGQWTVRRTENRLNFQVQRVVISDTKSLKSEVLHLKSDNLIHQTGWGLTGLTVSYHCAPCSKEGQWCPGRVGRALKIRDRNYSSLSSPGETNLDCRASSGTSVIWGEIGCWNQVSWRRLRRVLSKYVYTWTGEKGKDEKRWDSDSSQWYPVKRQEMGTNPGTQNSI